MAKFFYRIRNYLGFKMIGADYLEKFIFAQSEARTLNRFILYLEGIVQKGTWNPHFTPKAILNTIERFRAKVANEAGINVKKKPKHKESKRKN